METPDTIDQSCASSTDASGMLRRGSGLQSGAVLSPGKLLDLRDKVLCTQTADTAQCPGEMGQKHCICETTILTKGRQLPTCSNIIFILDFALKTAQTGLTDLLGTCWPKSGLAHLKLKPQPLELPSKNIAPDKMMLLTK